MTTTNPPPRILSIAGSDSSGGAGIQADIKTITMLGGYAMTAITAVTAQNTTGVQGVEALPVDFVGQQIDSCLSDIGADAIKIGMLGSPAITHRIADRLDTFQGPIVFDPVMVATSGSLLADGETIAAFARLMDIATIVTPNLPELTALTGHEIGRGENVIDAALELARRHDVLVLAKGGHASEWTDLEASMDEGDSNQVIDRIASPDGKIASFGHARIATRHTQGTGSTLTSALATLLGYRLPLTHAVRLAREFTYRAISSAPGFGAGSGPLGHQAVRSLS